MLTITKYHKHICYRKDGNRLGKRKEQIVLAKELERSMLKHKINSYAGTVNVGRSINIGCATVGIGRHVHASIGSMGTGIITINGIPYNSMDEFDRPVSDKGISQYIDFQFKARKAYKMETKLEDGDHTYYKPLEGAMLKPNVAEDRIWEAKKWEAELQNSYPENINPIRITPLPFREAGKSKDWLLEKIESATNDDIEPEYINNWIQTPSTIEVIDEQIKTK